jgi:hypothetical protein
MIGFRLWQIAGWTMLHYLWLGAALGAAALLLRRTLRSTTANVRYAAALISLLLLGIAPAAIAVVVERNIAPAVSTELPVMDDVAALPRAMPFEAEQTPMATIGDATGNSPVADRSIDVSQPAEAAQTPVSGRLLAAMELMATWLPWLWVCGAPLSFVPNVCGGRATRWKTPELAKRAGGWRTL